MSIIWNDISIKPTQKFLYDKKFIRKLVYDEGGFVREGFYDPEDDFWFSFIPNKDLTFKLLPLIVEKWADIPIPNSL